MPLYKTGQTKDGKQGYRVRINYTDASGNRQTKTKIVYGSQEAKDAEREMLRSAASQELSTRKTINELFTEYTKSKESEVRITSLDKTKRILNLHVIPYFENVRLDKLDKQKLQEWKQKIANKNLSITTRKNIFGEFRAMLNYAVKMDYTPQNQLLKIGNFRDAYFTKPQDKLHYYTAEQFFKFISAAANHMETISERGYYVFFNIAFYTGMRKGEINALKWSDIDDDIIHVRRSVAQKIKGNKIIETPPKNKSSYRDLQMPATLINILNEHKEKQKAACKNSSIKFSNNFRVCGGVSCLGDSSITNRNFQYANEAALPHIRIHDFRHSHASLLCNAGINIQEVAPSLRQTS